MASAAWAQSRIATRSAGMSRVGKKAPIWKRIASPLSAAWRSACGAAYRQSTASRWSCVIHRMCCGCKHCWRSSEKHRVSTRLDTVLRCRSDRRRTSVLEQMPKRHAKPGHDLATRQFILSCQNAHARGRFVHVDLLFLWSDDPDHLYSIVE